MTSSKTISMTGSWLGAHRASAQGARPMRPLSQAAMRFARAEDGAVTVDWVVLTAAIVLMGVAVGFAVTAGIPGIAERLSNFMTGMSIG